MHDLVIIGGGPAGMTAAIYAARKQLDIVMISLDIGGQATWAVDVDNYLGYRLISGLDLVNKFEEHVRDLGIKVVNNRVNSIKKKDKTFIVDTEDKEGYNSRTVIVATGRTPKELGVPGEDKYKGKGVAYCATCDAPLFAGEEVAVVGGGNAGLDATIQLISIARKVSLIESEPKLTGDLSLQENIFSASNVKILTGTEVVSFGGDNMLQELVVRKIGTNETTTIPATGVFVEIGSSPNASFLPDDIRTNEYKEIIIDCWNRTNVPGLYAAGDVTDIPHKQIIIAAGEGSKALLSTYYYLTREFPRNGGHR